MAKIVKHSYVLAVRDLARSTRYWQEVLGFRPEGIDAPGWSFLQRDGVRVMLGECPDQADAAATGDHSYFAYLNVDDVDAVAQEISSGGGTILFGPEDRPWGMRELHVVTVDGHRITFGQQME